MPKAYRRRALRPGGAHRIPNYVTERQRQLKRSAEIKMASFDSLPAQLRQVIANFAIEPADCEPILDLYYKLRQRGLAVPTIAELLAAEMAEAEQRAIEDANRRHRSRYGRDLPHIAAGVSVLRAAQTR